MGHPSSRWRVALAAAGVACLMAIGMPGSAVAAPEAGQVAASWGGTGLQAAGGAQVAADPVAGQTNRGNTLGPGQQIVGGEILRSTSGQFNISMFDAVGRGRLPLMYSRTCGWNTVFGIGWNPPQTLDTKLVMQTDGNLVAYQSSTPIWYSNTSGNPGAYLVVQNDGNIVVWSAAGQPIWNSSSKCDRIYTMENTAAWEANGLDDPLMLAPNDVMYSPNWSKKLVMQSDGNLVLYAGNRVLWNSNTYGNPGATLFVQPDGNIVIYNPAGRPLWWTGTGWRVSGGNEGMQLMVQDDGNLVAYRWDDISNALASVAYATNTRG